MRKFSRREFLMSGSAATGLTLLRPSALTLAQESAAPRLKTITYNVLKCHGFAPLPPAEAALARVSPEIPARIARELALQGPDIVTFQEGPPQKVLGAMARQLGMQHCLFAGGWHGAVLTRFKILESENRPGAQGPPPKELFTRHWGRALLDAGNETIALYSAHLHPSDAAVREREVAEILKVLARDLQAGKSLLFQGDLNHRPDGPEYERWTKAGLVDAFAVKGRGEPETFNSHKREKRIDYVWAHGPIARRLLECRVLNSGPFRVSPSDQSSFALSDHLPVIATFSR